MPRYFFSIEGADCDVDDEGIDLPGPVAARVNAVAYLGEYLRDHPDLIWDGQTLAVSVDDQNRDRIFRVRVESDEDMT